MHVHWQKYGWQCLALLLVVFLAGILRFSNLDGLGYGNHYYAAAVKSMLSSWHNFFYVAAEPGGSVSVDKPPVGLWLQTISAFIFGYQPISLLLPQILAGIGSVIVLYHLVQRSYGPFAGLLAALALAITPIIVATDRNNTIDSTLVFTLLLAAWAFIKATETKKLCYLIFGAILVGIGFNIKMMEAYLPLPAFFALYFLGAHEKITSKILKLGTAALVVVLVSLSWVVAVDLTPASQRPYIGSSTDNSEITLLIGYNGLNRLFGMNRNRMVAADNSQPSTAQSAAPSKRTMSPEQGSRPSHGQVDGSQRQSQSNQMQSRSANAGAQQPGTNASRGTPSNIGQASPLRLFIAPLSKEIGWLLPFAVISMMFLVFSARLQWPLSAAHLDLVLWGGWLLTGAIFFSVAQYFHEYYLVMIAAPLAALVGIGALMLWKQHQHRPWLAAGSLMIAVALTLVVQISTAQSYMQTLPWLSVIIILFLAGAILITIFPWVKTGRLVYGFGYAMVIISMCITPAVWSWYTMLNPSNNASLPSAFSGKFSSSGAEKTLQVNESLLNFLEANTKNTKYLMAVPSSMQGADYVIATGRPVLYLGGFKGQDQVLTLDEFIQLVDDGELSFVYNSGKGNNGSSEISTWVNQHCSAVDGYNTTTQNAGAPDGTSTGDGYQAMAISLYQCGI